MNTANRSAFLQTVRSALGLPPERRRTAPADLFPQESPEPHRRALQAIENRSPSDRRRLLQTLEAAAAPIRLQVLQAESIETAQDMVVQMASTAVPEWGKARQVCAWRHPLVDRLQLPERLQGCGIEAVHTATGAEASEDQRKDFTKVVWNSFIGVTSADFCVAETATLVLRTRPGQARCVSLVPSIHLAVIAADRILADLKELYSVLRWRDNTDHAHLTNCLTFISGPSKTADIEATLVHGAHGPREVCLIVLEA